MRLRASSKIWMYVVCCLVMAQGAASTFLVKSYTLTAITDWITLVLIVSASVAFTRNAFGNKGERRLAWILMGGGYAIETVGQLIWMRWELVLKQTPTISIGDGLVFLAWIILILGFALRPHVRSSSQHQRIGSLDLLLLLLSGLYLYLFLVIPWQYVTSDPISYGMAYKFLAMSQDVILLSIVVLGWRHSSGRWRHFYALLTAAVAFDTVMEYLVDSLANSGVYFSGGWYDSATAAGLAAITVAALLGNGLEAVSEREDPDSERYWRWASRLAAPITMTLPLLAGWSFFDRSLPGPVWTFRIVLSLVAIVVFAFVGIVKQARLEGELAIANRELLEASLTDPLTGIRNRRFFANSIEADVQQVLRSFASNPSSEHNRDLVFYLIDIDHFKKVNDEFGHQVGDQVLVEVARRINSAARLSDAVIRWGGEEFLLLSRYTDRKDAHVLASRVLDAIGSKPFRAAGGETDLHISCSIGWAAYPWSENKPKIVPHQQVLVFADYGLYQAKGSGRNQAVGALPMDETVQARSLDKAIYIDGTATRSVTTLGPQSGTVSANMSPAIVPKSEAASAGSGC